MKKERISSYKKLDKILIDILREQEKPISARQIEGIILNNFDTRRIRTTPRSLSYRLRNHPNVRTIRNKRGNLYSFF